ncbi:hypothetical protein ACJJTC_005065 [Scirpophaga incertulas]
MPPLHVGRSICSRRSRTKNSMENQLAELYAEPSGEFENFVRMSSSDFEYLLRNISPMIAKKDTNWRDSIPVKGCRSRLRTAAWPRRRSCAPPPGPPRPPTAARCTRCRSASCCGRARTRSRRRRPSGAARGSRRTRTASRPPSSCGSWASATQQEELFQAMQAQYDVARATTHTMRGVGLGFSKPHF